MAEERDPKKEWDKNDDGMPDVLDDPAERARLLRKYGYTERDLRTSAKRDLFYEAVRKEYSRKEAKQAFGEVYVNDQATVRDIVAESGFTMELIRAYPELREVFRKLSDLLARGKVTESGLFAKFEELMQDTAFGRRTDEEIAADLYRYQKGNQNNWIKRVEGVVTRLREYLTALNGGTIDDATADRIALELIYAGEENDRSAWNRRLTAWIKDSGTGSTDGGTTDFGGEMGTSQDTLMAWFARNGLVVENNELSRWLLDIQSGKETVESVKQWYRTNRLAVKYAGYADEFAKGFDATDVASYFKQSMSQLLERDMDSIDLNDPYLQKAMQFTDDGGKPRKMTGWEFDQLIRQSPDWQKTDNAMALYTDIGEGILRSFGFRG